MKTVMSKLMMVVLVTGLTASFARADDSAEKHPRRKQVVNRANTQEKKNDQAAANGQITQKQDNKLNRQDQKIKKEERADAAANGGHITKGEQKDLNRQENKVTKERSNMEKRDAAKNGTAPAPAAPAPATGTTN